VDEVKRAKQVISVFLLIIISQVFTPAEYIHAFFGHEDTICHAGSCNSIEPVHHHCKILQIAGAVFISPVAMRLPGKQLFLKRFSLPENSGYYPATFNQLHSRAPPFVS
jgi:hypothetical protein